VRDVRYDDDDAVERDDVYDDGFREGRTLGRRIEGETG